MPAFILSAIKAGITRLRTKGGASPDSLYDLVNAYVSADRGVVPRGGTVIVAELPAGEGGSETAGLMYFDGARHTFSARPIYGTMPSGYINHILPHPDPESGAQIAVIHLAEPFLGYPFVVAEFDDGAIHYYWLTGDAEGDSEWLPNHVYSLNETVHPTAPNGYYYAAQRLTPPGEIWAPDIERQIGDVVEPTVFNGYEYVCVNVEGATPRSGSVEPDWPTTEGAIVYEDADTTTPPTNSQTGGNGVPPDVGDRYGTRYLGTV